MSGWVGGWVGVWEGGGTAVGLLGISVPAEHGGLRGDILIIDSLHCN